jgi:hypothetical protein
VSIHLHIERLVLEGLPLEAAQGPAVQAAIEDELTRLLGKGGITRDLGLGGAVATRRGGDISIVSGDTSDCLGEKIAGAVYGGMRS